MAKPKISVHGGEREYRDLSVMIVENAVNRVGGLTAWAHLSASHREGLISREGLSVLMTQDEGHMTPGHYRRLAQLTARLASCACFDECMGMNTLEVDLDKE